MSKPMAMSGYLDGTGNSPHAAHADNVLRAIKKTIKVTDWDNKAADVTFTEGAYVGFIVDQASQAAATTAALVLSSVGTGKLTFGCTTTPAAALDVYVLYL
ncbi:MAG: hypothetical protein IJH25_08295 [Clostridia bacterium]|nr:hypothetical protein [Clostridia bacterium]